MYQKILITTDGSAVSRHTACAGVEFARQMGAQVLALYQAVKPLFEAMDLGIEELALTGRGSWQLVLDNGASVELGRGAAPEVEARTKRFLQTLTQVTSKYGRTPDALLSADLRHGDGYALRLRGVSTTEQKK